MIRRIKQEIRNYLTAKYDAEYFQELEAQVDSYDTWVREQENASREKDIEIIWDMAEEKKDFDFIILVEDVTQVSEEAVKHVAKVFNEKSQVEVVYGDEDEVNHNETIRMNPWFKPDYSPDTLLSYFYFGSLRFMSAPFFLSQRS